MRQAVDLRRGSIRTLLAGVLVLTPGCGAPWKPPTPRALRIAHEVDVASLDPSAATDSIARSVLSNVYDSLVEVDAEMRLVPALAVSWSTPDARAWVFRLREGLRFHDGRPLTADDARASIERARTGPDSAFRVLLASVERVESVGDLELRIRTLAPDPLLAARLATVFIAPAARPESLAAQPMGTGPYRFLRRDASGIEVEAFPAHWRGAPSVRRVVFTTVAPGEETLRALKSRSVDVLRFVPEPVTNDARHAPGFRVIGRPGPRALYLWMNARPQLAGRPNPFADPRVRRAVSLAVDRHAILEELGGQGVTMNQMVPPGVFGHVTEGPPLTHDPAAARQLLAAAGFPSGFDTRLTHVSGGEKIVESLRRSLAEVGVRAEPDRRDWPSMLADWRAARLPLFLGSWRFEFGEASLFFEQCVRSRGPATEASWNAGFSSPDLDRVITELGGIVPEDERLAHYGSLMRLAMDEMPLVPLLERFDLYAASDDVIWRPRLDGRLLAFEMSWRQAPPRP